MQFIYLNKKIKIAIPNPIDVNALSWNKEQVMHIPFSVARHNGAPSPSGHPSSPRCSHKSLAIQSSVVIHLRATLRQARAGTKRIIAPACWGYASA